MMPKPKALTAAQSMESKGPSEPEQLVESDERVDLDEDSDPEETMEEEVEYEEVEVEEEGEEEIEEEEEEEDLDVENANGADVFETKVEDGDEKRKHAELLARPPHGSEVYIGGIPHDVSQEDLKGFCESVGVVTEVRIMKGKDSTENKGFAFVTFRSVELASNAIDELNNADFKGRKIKCSMSQSKNRLFIGNIPRSWKEEHLRKALSEVGPGVTGLELVKDMKNLSNNRGFAFVEYYNNACAEYSRQKMMSQEFRLGDNAPNVSWADPKNADSSAASQVKAIYVKNLPKDVTQDQLKKLFEHHGKITKVVLPPAKPGQERNRIAFVHFAERTCAMKALNDSEKYELDGQVVECSLAKPLTDQKTPGGSSSQNSRFLPNYPPHVGYGLVGGAYGTLGPGYGVAGLAQPLIYGSGPSPTGMSMMPMLLPDGRIGYVLQQPEAQLRSPPPHQRNSKDSGSSNRGKHSNDGRWYRPY
ncbi:heterogeneous nuclear ribonucleoprotein Q isoform X1 [Gossypium raimondii]|uniref:RRM domain-containing protein n=2 Tax=Gossypium raimondii TaxID=29730 RepID=A0A0D2TLW9_GOSRA|nr:heterogeneous nuclear ribonucleoprotein Q isoform X1 [Gossypium raimondii]XP_012445977.1 heterogeneous nuclear ribonucleoprotein Q isoform X1 [Gossypium raimondii]XP_052487483.1 heterogeneous nuclear ribonucleoprotein Q isoform X1 [Gossypium raimondii]XP_052487484.1 heterogeneous nuclear ribonucleoprotein Q isoform X1 [Gossypium raimondii]XP_052487485.1 heterogeneous nuclear ribonucleoprotein Q isoform X1 [Gossypium raimondii]XP_052487486.1 heterogeneous nuclear ribonucleoprotein Q isoform 